MISKIWENKIQEKEIKEKEKEIKIRRKDMFNMFRYFSVPLINIENQLKSWVLISKEGWQFQLFLKKMKLKVEMTNLKAQIRKAQNHWKRSKVTLQWLKA